MLYEVSSPNNHYVKGVTFLFNQTQLSLDFVETIDWLFSVDSIQIVD